MPLPLLLGVNNTIEINRILSTNVTHAPTPILTGVGVGVGVRIGVGVGAGVGVGYH